jgi:exonuclease VII small subunit
VRAILEKALDTIGEHPEIVRILARSVNREVRESLEGSVATLDSALEGLEVGDTVDEALRERLEEVRTSLEDVLERAHREAEGVTRRGALGEAQDGDARTSP